MDNGGMELDVIANPKVTEDGQSIIQVSHIAVFLPRSSYILTQ